MHEKIKYEMLKKVTYLLFIQKLKKPNASEVSTMDRVGTNPLDKKVIDRPSPKIILARKGLLK